MKNIAMFITTGELIEALKKIDPNGNRRVMMQSIDNDLELGVVGYAAGGVCLENVRVDEDLNIDTHEMEVVTIMQSGIDMYFEEEK